MTDRLALKLATGLLKACPVIINDKMLDGIWEARDFRDMATWVRKARELLLTIKEGN